MLGVLCARSPKPWILSSLSSSAAFFHPHHHGSAAVGHHILQPLVGNPIEPDDWSRRTCFHLKAAGRGEVGLVGCCGSVWHEVVPEAEGIGGDWRRDHLLPAFLHHHQYPEKKRGGEGSWNVLWDARPARWIYRLDLTWLFIGACVFLLPSLDWSNLVKADNQNLVFGDGNSTDREEEEEEEEEEEKVTLNLNLNLNVCDNKTDAVKKISEEQQDKYRVTGVPADGRCLFRAIAHVACVQSGEEAPDENRQRELADELRARVVDELLKRREETEWFIEGDFDSYVKRIRQPFVWGGEPELLMASHVLKTQIAVYMRDENSGNLTRIASYGEEYQREKEKPINVLFRGYGHYDILDTCETTICAEHSRAEARR